MRTLAPQHLWCLLHVSLSDLMSIGQTAQNQLIELVIQTLNINNKTT